MRPAGAQKGTVTRREVDNTGVGVDDARTGKG